MLRFLPPLALLVFTIFTVVDCVQTDESLVKGLPKVVWIFVILLFPLVGGIAWWSAGRPHRPHLPGTGPRPVRRGPIGPDDDPDFLRGL